MSQETFKPDPEQFDKLYRGEPAFGGGPAPTAIPWDVGQAQPRLMELEALGAIAGDVLDIGCGLGDNAIFLASKGYSVTAIDGSPAAIEQAKARADVADVQIAFDVADATELTGYDGRFDTVVDSALYHCLDDAGRIAYATALHRATREGARWFLYCFAGGDVNGITAPMGAVPELNITETLTGAGWRITFTGPTTYLGNRDAFGGSFGDLPAEVLEQLPPDVVEQMKRTVDRYTAILPFVADKVHLPFTVVHAVRA